MDNFIFKFILEKLKITFLLALIIAMAIYVIFGYKFMLAYTGGFLTGCMNFILLSLGSYVLVLAKPGGAKVINTLFFIIRYLIIAFITVKLVVHNNYNIFAIAVGLITMQISIVVYALKKKHSNNLLTGKEG